MQSPRSRFSLLGIFTLAVLSACPAPAANPPIIEGATQGEQKAKLEIAKSMKAAGMTNAQIQAITGLSTSDLEP
jgi:hypothetical protein